MNYYPHHIGDFDKATRHLTRTERSIYRDLIEVYYDTEKPLTLDETSLRRKVIAQSEEEIAAVDQVLNEFFTRTDAGWYHDRCKEEIEAYYKAKANHWGNFLTKDQRAAIQGERNATKASATPTWLTKEDRMQISAVYAEAATKTASTGIPHEVDHIVPLRSKLVCGMHVPWNLQVLTAAKNRTKSNLFRVVMA